MPGSSQERAQKPPGSQQRISSFSHPRGIRQAPPSVFFPSPDLKTIQRVPDRVLKDALHSPHTKHENPARLSPFFALTAWPASGLQPQTCHSLFTSFCWICLYFILLSPPGTLLSPSSLHPCPSPLPSPQQSPVPLSTHKKATDQSGNFFTVPMYPPPPQLLLTRFFEKVGAKSQQQLVGSRNRTAHAPAGNDLREASILNFGFSAVENEAQRGEETGSRTHRVRGKAGSRGQWPSFSA